MTSKKQQALDTQQKILRVTEKMIRERGTFDLSMEEIAKACGIVKGTLYHYYRSKDELLLKVSQNLYDQLKAQFSTRAHTASSLDQLRSFIADWYLMTEQVSIPFDADHSQLFNAIGKDPQTLTAQENGMEIIHACLEAAVKEGELAPETPVKELTLMLIFAMHGSALHKHKYDKDFDLQDWALTFSSLLFDFILKPYTIST